MGQGLESEQVHARVESEISHRQRYAVVFGLYGKAAMTRAAIAGPAKAAKDVVALRAAPAGREADAAQVSTRAEGKRPVSVRRSQRQEAGSSSEDRWTVAVSGSAADGARAMGIAQQMGGEEVGEADVGQARGRRREHELVFSEAALLRLHAFMCGSRASDAMAAGGVVCGEKRGRSVETAESGRHGGDTRLYNSIPVEALRHEVAAVSSDQQWAEPSKFPRRADDECERDEDGDSRERERCSSPRREDDGGDAQRDQQGTSEGDTLLCANGGQSARNLTTVSKDNRDTLDFSGSTSQRRVGSEGVLEGAAAGAERSRRAGKRRVVPGETVESALGGRVETEGARTSRRRRVQSDGGVTVVMMGSVDVRSERRDEQRGAEGSEGESGASSSGNEGRLKRRVTEEWENELSGRIEIESGGTTRRRRIESDDGDVTMAMRMDDDVEGVGGAGGGGVGDRVGVG